MTNERRTYEITIDAATDDPITELRELAAASGATFTNIRFTTPDAARFAANDVTLAFDATRADIELYATFYDADFDRD